MSGSTSMPAPVAIDVPPDLGDIAVTRFSPTVEFVIVLAPPAEMAIPPPATAACWGSVARATSAFRDTVDAVALTLAPFTHPPEAFAYPPDARAVRAFRSTVE